MVHEVGYPEKSDMLRSDVRGSTVFIKQYGLEKYLR